MKLALFTEEGRNIRVASPATYNRLSRRAGDSNHLILCTQHPSKEFQCLSRRAGDSNLVGQFPVTFFKRFNASVGGRAIRTWAKSAGVASPQQTVVSMPQPAGGRFERAVSRLARLQPTRFNASVGGRAIRTQTMDWWESIFVSFNASVGGRAIRTRDGAICAAILGIVSMPQSAGGRFERSYSNPISSWMSVSMPQSAGGRFERNILPRRSPSCWFQCLSRRAGDSNWKRRTLPATL